MNKQQLNFKYPIKKITQKQNSSIKTIQIKLKTPQNNLLLIKKLYLFIQKLKSQKLQLIHLIQSPNKNNNNINSSNMYQQSSNKQPSSHKQPTNTSLNSTISQIKDYNNKQTNIQQNPTLLSKLKHLQDQNTHLNSQISLLTSQINTLNQKLTQQHQNPLLTTNQQQNELLKSNLQKLTTKYKKIKKNNQSIKNTYQNLQSTEFQQQIIMLSQVQCQTDPIQSPNLSQQITKHPNSSQHNVQTSSFTNNHQSTNQYLTDKDQLINKLQHQLIQLKNKQQSRQPKTIQNNFFPQNTLQFQEQVMLLCEVQCQTDIQQLQISSHSLPQLSSSPNQKLTKPIHKRPKSTQNQTKQFQQHNDSQYIQQKQNQISQLQLKLFEKDKILTKIVKQKQILTKQHEHLIQQYQKLLSCHTTQQLNNLLSSKTQQIQQLKQQITKFQQNQLSTQHQLESLKSQIIHLQQQLKTINQKNNTQEQLSRKLQQLNNVLQFKQQSIQSLKKQLIQSHESSYQQSNQDKQTINHLTQQLKQMQNHINDNNIQFQQLQQQHNQISTTLTQKNQQIQQLNQKLKSLQQTQLQSQTTPHLEFQHHQPSQDNNKPNQLENFNTKNKQTYPHNMQTIQFEQESIVYHEVQCQTEFQQISNINKQIQQPIIENNKLQQSDKLLNVNRKLNLQSPKSPKQLQQNSPQKISNNSNNAIQQPHNHPYHYPMIQSVTHPLPTQIKKTSQIHQNSKQPQPTNNVHLQKQSLFMPNPQTLSRSLVINSQTSKNSEKIPQSTPQLTYQQPKNKLKQQPTKISNSLSITDLNNLQFLYIEQACQQKKKQKLDFKPLYVSSQNPLRIKPTEKLQLDIRKQISQQTQKSKKNVKFQQSEGEQQMILSPLKLSQQFTPLYPNIKKKSTGILKPSKQLS